MPQDSYTDLEEKLARAQRERDEALEQQKATVEVLRLTSVSSGDLQGVFAAILENATRLCQANFGTLLLCEGDFYRQVAFHNAPPAFVEARRLNPMISMTGSTALARLAATKHPVHIADVASDPAYQIDPQRRGFVTLTGVRTNLAVPMLIDDRLIGAINIYRTEVRPFSDRQIELLKSFAAQAVIAAGGPTDIVARMLADKLSKMWDQQVFIENKGGAGTNIGNEYAARSDPDGYTILFATASLGVNTSLYRSLSYDPVADFEPVSLVTQLVYFVFVPNSSPAHSIKEFINYAKSLPGKLTMASPGTGSAPFLAEMLFLQMAGIQMTHVPYRGASPAFVDLIPGRVDCYFGSGTLLSYSRSGQVRVLATTGAKRDPAAPEVLTIAEGGVPGYDVTGWQALFVPARTPSEIVRKISADTNTALADPEIKEKLPQTGYLARGSSPEELERLLKSEIVKWSAVIKSVGIKID